MHVKALGDVYYAQSKYTQAEEYRDDRSFYAHLPDDRGEASRLKALGDVYSAQFKVERARWEHKETPAVHNPNTP
ncbi:hypothetical protein M407DRAFT_19695 [Tulasnella calospora MUT 4182]|uniref:Uncharacterized protein n=1 Tax=Tulasnella calospora MUT 4182 TaxID=1051891 RepID=A0A0C3QHK0_9AGAM|nr:hypothetical protein M407DRAFT_19695 [Tulasnella calospora MUT 4182]